MIRPLALLLGLRYTRAKRRNHFISFISLASMLGIALGVTVLITVLSVMNGFDYQIRSKFFALVPQVSVLTSKDISSEWRGLRKQLLKNKEVEAIAPFVSGQAMLVHSGQLSGIEILGIDPKEEPTVSKINQAMVAGKLTSLTPNAFNIILGQTIATQLGVNVGDKINVLTPQTSITLAGVFPRYKTFTVSGIFHSTSGLNYDRAVAYVNMSDAGKLFLTGQRTSGLHLKLKDIYQAGNISSQLDNTLPNYFSVSNWTEQYGAFFKALAMEKIMLFIILLLIVAVAAFNLVSTLVMVVNDKRSDIAILRTLGASPGTIMRAFIIQGCVVGLVGTFLGLVGGVILSLSVTRLTNFIQSVFHVQLISSSVYFVNYLPSRIDPMDILYVCVIAFSMSLVATIYPAIIAFRTQPAEALRYE